MKIVGANVHFQKLEAKCSSPTFYQSYLEMIAAQELSEFLHMEIRFKYENEVLEFYKNGKKKLKEKLHLPNTGSEIGRLPAKNLDWKTIGISGQIPSGPAKKSDLKNDYKLVLELVIACLECGNGGHADDITQERAFIINALITKSKKARNMEPDIGFTTWLPKENKVSSIAEESSSDNVLIMSLKKSVKRKQVVSPSPSAEAPQNLALLNLEKKKKKFLPKENYKGRRKGKSPLPQHLEIPTRMSWWEGNLLRKPLPTTKALNNLMKKFLKFKVLQFLHHRLKLMMLRTNSGRSIMTGELGRNYEDLHLEHLVTSPVSEFEADDEDPSAYKPIFSKATEDQMDLTTEAQENAASPQQEQSQTTSEEKLLQLLQSHVQEILTTPCEISNQHELEIPEKSEENLEKSTPPETNEVQEDQVVEIQRSFAEGEKEAQIDGLETSETPAAIFEQNIGQEERDSFSRDISNFVLDETEEEFEKTLKIDDDEAEQGDAESLPCNSSIEHLLLIRQEIERMEARHNKLMEKSKEKYCSDLKEISKSVDKTLDIISLLSNSVSNTMEAYASDCHLQLKEVNKIREQIATITKEAFRLFGHFRTYTGNRNIDVIVQHNSPSLIPQLPIEVKEGELTYIPFHLNMTELILEAQQSNPENSTQHLTDSGLDGSEVVGTIASHFSDDAQTKERYNNLRCIKEQCGIMQGIGETAVSSKCRKQ
ncbi:unnamed protein product [Cuscuta campestris]|uniref:Uncharacterized protein n=1 Tax=Cuscuta campestris TaxID=132261 RepID=A0A484NGZ2_9ASTE|nr:unnamed protein product [Cuscuta campestris]